MAPDAEWYFPPIPPEHKSLTPYFQRAQELRTKDPVMAYWCTFYAVQEGITTKPQNTQFLMHILNALEHMKGTLSDNEAVVNNSMGAAYIEDFALRVFNMADNEDRKGLATRSTAKKFLASANFLEVLRVFEKPLDADVILTTIQIIEKIRYAKWKAADLAKAFREGRKPTPGDIDAPPRPSEAATLPSPPTAAITSSSPEATHVSLSSPEHVILPLPSVMDAPSTPSPRAFGKHLDLDRDNGYATPGMWSTVATPGVDDAYRMNGDADEPDVKKVHFSPSVVGGLSSASSSIVSSPELDAQSPTMLPRISNGSPTQFSSLAPRISDGFGRSGSPPTALPVVPSIPAGYTPLPPPPSALHPTPRYSIVPLDPVRKDLSPTQISRIQKHCRFAISALDYEDAETARKELHAALAMLEG
ncbi:Vta1 like-domain-containing protein [Hysterangium stoloniferum]|nr:Vta1 like-domain-containing protein [Hysterangium stoloniferum]